MFITPVNQLQSRLPVNKRQAALYFSSQQQPTTDALNQHPLMRRMQAAQGTILYHGQHNTKNADTLLQDAIREKTSFEIDGNMVRLRPFGKKHFVNAHHPLSYWKKGHAFPHGFHPEKIHPQLYMPRIRQSGLFTKFDFKTPAAIEPLGDLANTLPTQQQMAHVVYGPLDYRTGFLPPDQQSERFTQADLDRLRDKLGHNVPVFVSCKGLRQQDLTDDLLKDVAAKIKGRAQFVNFNIPGNKNIPPAFARKAWNDYGIIPEIKITSIVQREFWDLQRFPYLGITNNNALATRL